MAVILARECVAGFCRADELADFHRTYVSQLERRVTNISIDGLERLAMALGVDIAALLEDKKSP